MMLAAGMIREAAAMTTQIAGEVIPSEATRRQAADRLPGVVFEPLGPAVMKGIPSPIPIFRALREGS